MSRLARSVPAPAPTRRSGLLGIGLATAATLPGVVIALTGAHPSAPLQAVVYGVAIIGAAFLLSWAAEAAQVDISAGLAIAVLALIAVLPEYAVDFVFTFRGGADYARYGVACAAPGSTGETNCGLALANMTGANRILVGVGWSMVVLLAAWRIRSRARQRAAGTTGARTPSTRVDLSRAEAVPLAHLLLACVYALTLPLKSRVTLVDCLVLVGIFVAYTVRIARAPAGEPHLVGPARWVGSLAPAPRRASYLAMVVVAAAVILLTAHHFADALVETGTDLGISQFLLVQWLAPLASEAPELLVAGLYAWRLNTDDALATLVSSKVNQWTLLVGTLPLVFTLAAHTSPGPSSGTWGGLPADAAQREELLLTAAQSLFAVALLVGLTITVRGALGLLGLFAAQFALAAVLPSGAQDLVLVGLSVVYLVLAVVLFVRQRQRLGRLLRDGFRTPYSVLSAPSTPPGPAG